MALPRIACLACSDGLLLISVAELCAALGNCDSILPPSSISDLSIQLCLDYSIELGCSAAEACASFGQLQNSAWSAKTTFLQVRHTILCDLQVPGRSRVWTSALFDLLTSSEPDNLLGAHQPIVAEEMVDSVGLAFASACRYSVEHLAAAIDTLALWSNCNISSLFMFDLSPPMQIVANRCSAFFEDHCAELDTLPAVLVEACRGCCSHMQVPKILLCYTIHSVFMSGVGKSDKVCRYHGLLLWAYGFQRPPDGARSSSASQQWLDWLDLCAHTVRYAFCAGCVSCGGDPVSYFPQSQGSRSNAGGAAATCTPPISHGHQNSTAHPPSSFTEHARDAHRYDLLLLRSLVGRAGHLARFASFCRCNSEDIYMGWSGMLQRQLQHSASILHVDHADSRSSTLPAAGASDQPAESKAEPAAKHEQGGNTSRQLQAPGHALSMLLPVKAAQPTPEQWFAALAKAGVKGGQPSEHPPSHLSPREPNEVSQDYDLQWVPLDEHKLRQMQQLVAVQHPPSAAAQGGGACAADTLAEDPALVREALGMWFVLAASLQQCPLLQERAAAPEPAAAHVVDPPAPLANALIPLAVWGGRCLEWDETAAVLRQGVLLSCFGTRGDTSASGSCTVAAAGAADGSRCEPDDQRKQREHGTQNNALDIFRAALHSAVAKSQAAPMWWSGRDKHHKDDCGASKMANSAAEQAAKQIISAWPGGGEQDKAAGPSTGAHSERHGGWSSRPVSCHCGCGQAVYLP